MMAVSSDLNTVDEDNPRVCCLCCADERTVEGLKIFMVILSTCQTGWPECQMSPIRER